MHTNQSWPAMPPHARIRAIKAIIDGAGENEIITSSDIARRLGATRNAIMGFMHRNKLALPLSRANGFSFEDAMRKVNARGAKYPGRSSSRRRTSRPQKHTWHRAGEPHTVGIPFDDVCGVAAPTQCKWPLWNDDSPERLVCGSKVSPHHKVYCAAHAAMGILAREDR